MPKNFAYSLVATAPSPATSGTSLVVTAADGAKFPTVPFNATIWPINAPPLTSNAEIVIVTGVSTDTLTIVRAQEDSTARTVIVGDQIAATISAAVLPQGNMFQSQNALPENLVLKASTNFTYDNLLEIGSTAVLEIPSTSTLEIESYVDQPTLNNTLGVAADANVSFQSIGATTQNIILPVATDYIVEVQLEIGRNYNLEIPPNSSLEIEAQIDQPFMANTLGTAPDANLSFISQGPITIAIVLPPYASYGYVEVVEVGVAGSLEIPPTSSLEIVGHNSISNPPTILGTKGGTTNLTTGFLPWTPVWTNLTVSGSTVNANYFQIGKLVFFHLAVILAGGNAPSGSVSFSLPVASISYPGTATLQAIGQCQYFITNAYYGPCVWASTTTANMTVNNATATYDVVNNISATVPNTFTNGSELHASGFYEAA